MAYRASGLVFGRPSSRIEWHEKRHRSGARRSAGGGDRSWRTAKVALARLEEAPTAPPGILAVIAFNVLDKEHGGHCRQQRSVAAAEEGGSGLVVTFQNGAQPVGSCGTNRRRWCASLPRRENYGCSCPARLGCPPHRRGPEASERERPRRGSRPAACGARAPRPLGALAPSGTGYCAARNSPERRTLSANQSPTGRSAVASLGPYRRRRSRNSSPHRAQRVRREATNWLGFAA